VYNGFDESRLVGLTAERHNEDLITVTMVARMEPEKDHQLLLSAARALGEQQPGRWRFVLVGSGSARESLASAAQSVRGAVVEFMEMGLEALPAVASADIGALLTAPGYGEGCSNSIIEYMALGLPVVCSDGGGNREIVDDGVTGLVVPQADVGAFVAALQRVGEDPSLRAALGAAGQAAVRARFSVTALVEGYLSIYDDLACDRR